jgi:GTPase SAR1 family protein
MKVMLVGTAGSGKTTLTKMLVHDQKPKRLAPTEIMEVEEWRLK